MTMSHFPSTIIDKKIGQAGEVGDLHIYLKNEEPKFWMNCMDIFEKQQLDSIDLFCELSVKEVKEMFPLLGWRKKAQRIIKNLKQNNGVKPSIQPHVYKKSISYQPGSAVYKNPEPAPKPKPQGGTRKYGFSWNVTHNPWHPHSVPKWQSYDAETCRRLESAYIEHRNTGQKMKVDVWHNGQKMNYHVSMDSNTLMQVHNTIPTRVRQVRVVLKS
eukprot:UN25261